MKPAAITVAIAVVFSSSMSLAAHAAETAKALKGPFHLVFDRHVTEGFRYEMTGTCRFVQAIHPSQEGLNLGDMDSYLEAQYDVIEKVTKVSEVGRAQELRVYFKSLKTRDDNGATYDDASCIGVPINVVVWPDASIQREDGQEILPDEMKVLNFLYPKDDPTSPTDDDLLDPSHDVSVGDTWHPSGASIARHWQSEGVILPDNGANVTLKVVGTRKESGVDCVVVNMIMAAPAVDGDSSMPAAFKSIHASMETTAEWALPIDSTRQVISTKTGETTKFTAVVDSKDDDTTVQLKGQFAASASETFVKAL